MKNLKKMICRIVPDFILMLGAAAISIGIGLYSFPAGLIAGGVLIIAGTVLYTLGGDGQ